MGKITKVKNKAIKKRNKKFDPYKTNPLNKKLTKALKGEEKALRDAMDLDEDGSIKLDSAGKPVFKDSIQWDTNSAQIMAIWSACKAALEEKIVPPNEQDAVFDLMAMYAKEHRDGSTKNYTIAVPINYFVGTWHVLNSCRMFDLFHNDKKLSEAIDGLTMWFAERLDMYHSVKKAEKIEEEVSPDNILKLPERVNHYKKPEETKVLPFKKPE